jgi:16S rRNA (guanine966-N2)-methyltransferase
VGSIGLEAISRGARSAVFVEKAAEALSILERNIESLGFGPRCEVMRGSALAIPYVKSVPPPGFALVFLDPPFSMFEEIDDAERVFRRAMEFLRSPALEQDGVVLLRVPSHFSACPAVRAAEEVAYGESKVFCLEKSSA